MKTQFRKTTAWLLTLAMLMTFIPSFTLTASAEGETSGSLSDKVSWSFDTETGVLTISGSGDMPFQTDGSQPYYQYKSQITSVVISEGITSVGGNAFYYFTKITEVSLPSTLKSIGTSAFEDTYFGSITIPNGVTTIGVGAFRNSNITSIVLPASVTKIQGSAFQNAYRLQTVEVLGDLTEVGNYAFYTCSNLESVTFHGNVTKFGNNVFYRSGSKELTIYYWGTTQPEYGTSLFQTSGSSREVSHAYTHSTFLGYGIKKTTQAYSITVGNDGNGTATSDAASYKVGETVSLTATPNDGYRLKEWQIVSGNTTGKVAVVDNKMTMPASDVEVKAVFEVAPPTYTVTVATSENGTVVADVSEAAEGDTVTLTVTPADGYVLNTLTVKDADDNDVTVTDNTFTMPAKAVTVTAVFKVITEHTINWSGPANVVNTPEFDLMPYMPDDVVITGFSQALSTIISGITPTYSTGVAKVKLTTNTFDEPTSGTVSVIFKTEQYGDITFNINITLTGKYIVNISALPKDALYDGNAHSGYSNLSGTLTSGASYEGTYSYSYETADGTALDGAPTEVGNYKVTIAVPDDNENYKGSLTLEFSIKDASEPEASYQSTENGEWISGTFTEALTSVYAGGTVKLLKDIILTDTVTVAKNVTITSDNTDSPRTITSETDQHGYLLKLLAEVTLENIIIDGGSEDSITGSRAMIAVGDGTTSGKLTLGAGVILRNNNNTTTNGAGGAVCVILGDLVVSGGQISGNTAYSGSAIATVNNNNNVTIENGSVISDNKATNTAYSGGGAIYISAGIVTMTGGEIKNNTAVTCGGAVFVTKASTTGNATFKLQGGSITGNTAKYGGGIYISNAELLELSGGSVTGNTASSWGGGLLVAPDAYVEISGSVNISGNTNSSDEAGENLYLDGYEYNGINMPTVTVSKLDSTANIDMYSWLKPASGGELLIASPADGYTLTADDLDKLSYEDTNYSLKLNDSGNVVLTDEIKAPINFLGAQIRTSGPQGLRFIFTMTREYYETLTHPTASTQTGEGFGSVIIPSSILGEAVLTKETENAGIVPAVYLFDITDTTVMYTVCVTDIIDYEMEYVVVPYVTDVDGNTIYGEYTEAINVYEIAELAYADENTSADVKEYLLTNILNKVDSAKYPVE